MGARITVRVVPRSSRTAIEAGEDGGWRVRVNAPPADGKANAAVTAVVAEATGVARSSVRIVTGESSRTKVIEVAGLDDQELAAALSRAARGKGER